jgi:hypothetical protein
MPMTIKNPETTGRDFYHNVFIGRVDHPSHVKLAAGAFTVDTVDSDGWLKPGIPLTKVGVLPIDATTLIYGCTIEEMKVGDGNSVDQLAAAAARGLFAVVNTIGLVNRDLLETNLGRALSAGELLAFGASPNMQLTKSV